jgi:hypothetical protein
MTTMVRTISHEFLDGRIVSAFREEGRRYTGFQFQVKEPLTGHRVSRPRKVRTRLPC